MTEVEFNCGCGHVLFLAETKQCCSVGDSFLGGDRKRVVGVRAEKCFRQRCSGKAIGENSIQDQVDQKEILLKTSSLL